MKTIFLQLIIVEEKTIFNMNRRKEIIMISAEINGEKKNHRLNK
jgi:hypothetical protein